MGPRPECRIVFVDMPMRTERGQNNREHHFERHRRVKKERAETAVALRQKMKPGELPPLPLCITLTRISPGHVALDDDNLSGSLKAVRDAVAVFFRVNDNDPRVKWRYAQHSGPWGVTIRVAPLYEGDANDDPDIPVDSSTAL